MSLTTMPAVRAAVLSLLCVVGAALPETGFGTDLSPVVNAARPSSVGADETFLKPNPAAMPVSEPEAPLILGELAGSPGAAPAGPSTYVPILLYHYIRINPNPADRVGFNLSTTPALFATQMKYLADHGFHVVSLHQAVLAVASHTPMPSRPVVLTFDDGYADFFTEALPVMRAHNFTATDFVISGRMGARGFMTAGQVEAADQLGFTIGAHTVDHYALTGLTPARAAWEMRQSKLTLESLLGHPVRDFAYPYGCFNGYDISQARQLGFETALSTMAGTLHAPQQLFYLSRVRIGGAMTMATYAHLVGGPGVL